MFVATHAMLPVVLSTAGDIVSSAKYRKILFSAGDRWAFAFCGVLPDILRPHLGLSSRLTSFSHTVWFVLIALPIILILSYLWHSRNFVRFSLICWFAILLHLCCDMIAGGIAPFYPLSGIKVGFYHIQPKFWILLDVMTIFLFLAELVCLRIIETKTVRYFGATDTGLPRNICQSLKNLEASSISSGQNTNRHLSSGPETEPYT